MQDMLITVLMAADVFVALIIIALVLVQRSKEGALGSPFGGVGESVFGAHATSHLARLTVIFSVLFLSITLVLAIIIGHRARSAGIVDRELAIREAEKDKEAAKNEKDEEGKPDLAKTVEEAPPEAPVATEKISDEAMPAQSAPTESAPTESAPATAPKAPDAPAQPPAQPPEVK